MSPLFNVTNACKQISYEQLVTSTLFGLIYYYLQLNEDNNYKKYQYISIINERFFLLEIHIKCMYCYHFIYIRYVFKPEVQQIVLYIYELLRHDTSFCINKRIEIEICHFM